MSNVLEDSLFVSQNKKFDEIRSIVRQFSAESECCRGLYTFQENGDKRR